MKRRIGIPIIFCVIILISQTTYAQLANFSTDVVSGCAPLTVNFKDQSSGVTSWNWDLGKGDSPSLIKDPSTIYTQPGKYVVVLKINGGQISATKTITVFEKPEIALSASPEGICVPLKVLFHDDTSLSSGKVSSWRWVFGDGDISTEQHPTHTYIRPGDYSTTLTVKNEYGCENLLVKASLIHASGTVPEFVATPDEVCSAPAAIQFLNQSTGTDEALIYAWDFNDGEKSSEKNVIHEFKKPGEYPVSLTVTNKQGCGNTIISNVKIGKEPAIDFTTSALKACIKDTISFAVQSLDFITSYNWDFGNGVLSSAENPDNKFEKAGKYTVMLQARLAGKTCLSLVKKEIEIIDDAKPDFTWKSLCKNNIEFKSTSLKAASLLWEFKDKTTSKEFSFSHNFNAAKDDTIKLTAYNDLGCKTLLKKVIHIPTDPVAKFSPSETQSCSAPSLAGCAPYLLDLKNITSSDLPFTSHWLFSDGFESNDNYSIAHPITKKGSYILMLAVENISGCRDTARVKFEVADEKPTAEFSIEKIEVCQGEEVVFKNLSINADFFCWDFGDGDAISSLKSDKEIKHKYKKTGQYIVTLIAKNAGCSDVFTSTDIITVADPQGDFFISKDCKDPYRVQFFNLSENYSSLKWDFGDGSNSDEEAPSHTYSKMGGYEINLWVDNATSRCSVKVVASVNIQELHADFVFDNDVVCKGNKVRFTDQSESATKRYWQIITNYDKTGRSSDSIVQVNDSTAFSYQFDKAGHYTISLIVMNSDDCRDVKTVDKAIQVLDISGDFSFSAQSNCAEFDAAFVSQSKGSPPANKWIWDFGDGAYSEEQYPHHIYKKLGKYPVSLAIGNGEGSCLVRKKDLIVFTNPVVDFSLSQRNYCTNTTVQFNNHTKNATAFNWDLGNGHSNAPAPAIKYSEPGKYSIKVTAVDKYGCEKELMQPEYISINKPVARFDAMQISGACPPLITTFVDRSLNGVTNWNWAFGDNQKSASQNPVNTYKQPGVYNVCLIVSDKTGCKDTITMKDLISLDGPYGKFNTLASSCAKEPLSFVAQTTNANSHTWDFGDGVVIDAGPEIIHSYQEPGKYKPSLTITNKKGCKVILDQNEPVTIFNLPKIDFTIDPALAFTGEKITFMDSVEEELKIDWTIGTMQSHLQGDTVQFIFDESDNEASVLLSAETVHGCKATSSKTLIVQQDIPFIPNVFTPNDDDINATFEIEGIEKGYWQLIIYNRWGKPVYNNTDYRNDWDGKGLSAGIYYYALINTLRTNKFFKGHVSIIR